MVGTIPKFYMNIGQKISHISLFRFTVCVTSKSTKVIANLEKLLRLTRNSIALRTKKKKNFAKPWNEVRISIFKFNDTQTLRLIGELQLEL